MRKHLKHLTPQPYLRLVRVDAERAANAAACEAAVAAQSGHPAPSERWYDLRRGQIKPMTVLTRLLCDAAEHGLPREQVAREFHQALDRAVDAAYGVTFLPRAS